MERSFGWGKKMSSGELKFNNNNKANNYKLALVRLNNTVFDIDFALRVIRTIRRSHKFAYNGHRE